MKRTFFKLKINIPDLDKAIAIENSDPSSFEYKTELVIEDEETLIKIFFPDKEYLDDKISWWNQKSEVELLRYFEVIEILESKDLLDIDFSDFEYKGISTSSNFYEFGLKYFIIKINGIRKKYTDSNVEKTEFYLSKAGFQLVEMNYEYPFKFPWVEGPYELTPKNNVLEFIKFDKIEFKPEHNFFNRTKYDSALVSIQKEPRLIVKHDGLTEKEIRKRVSLLCALFSFYANDEIDYFVARIQAKDGFFYEKRDYKQLEINGHGIFMWDFYRNPLNLIVSVDAPHLIQNFEFVTNTITRFNYALKLKGESKFMILYNILEQIRNQYILDKKIEQEKAGENPNPKKVIEQYIFNHSKTQTDKFIKETLEKIVEIVHEDHKEIFKSEINQKVGGIKLMSMANQFKSLFECTNMDPSKYDLDFIKIKDLRNTIFHGSPVGDDSEYLEKVNSYERFPRFVGIMILKYFGIDDLSQVKKEFQS